MLAIENSRVWASDIIRDVKVYSAVVLLFGYGVGEVIAYARFKERIRQLDSRGEAELRRMQLEAEADGRKHVSHWQHVVYKSAYWHPERNLTIGSALSPIFLALETTIIDRPFTSENWESKHSFRRRIVAWIDTKKAKHWSLVSKTLYELFTLARPWVLCWVTGEPACFSLYWTNNYMSSTCGELKPLHCAASWESCKTRFMLILSHLQEEELHRLEKDMVTDQSWRSCKKENDADMVQRLRWVLRQEAPNIEAVWLCCVLYLQTSLAVFG